jgi:hypothetical protein
MPAKRLIGPAGNGVALDLALEHLEGKQLVIANRGKGEMTRQKRLAGTPRKLRFVFFLESCINSKASAGPATGVVTKAE